MATTRERLASTTCVCPKECDIVHYKVSNSYAAANENGENQFELSEKYLKNVAEQLKESIDTQERLLPDKRRANIKEIERVRRGLPDLAKLLRLSEYTQYIQKDTTHDVCYDYLNEFVFQKMQDILHNRFVVGWDKMNLYDCTSDSFELSKTLTDSVDMIDNECLRTTLLLRLGEKITALKRVLDNLDRVHDAYCNAVPLTNYTVTPNGSYDSFYLTAELFKQSKKMNEIHTRLRGHINKYIENIYGLYHIYTADGHEIQTKNKVLNYTNGLWLASVEYDRDLTAYESFVIRQPLQRIIKARNRFKDYKIRDVAKRSYLRSKDYYLDLVKMLLNSSATDSEHAYREMIKYQNGLENAKNVSKLHLADELTKAKITQMVIVFQTSFSRIIENNIKLYSAASSVYRIKCACFVEAEDEPILRAVFVKLYSHYKVATASEKAVMREYLQFEDDDSFRGNLVRCEMSNKNCLKTNIRPPRIISDRVSYQNFTLFIQGLEHFLETTLLDAKFFR